MHECVLTTSCAQEGAGGGGYIGSDCKTLSVLILFNIKSSKHNAFSPLLVFTEEESNTDAHMGFTASNNYITFGSHPKRFFKYFPKRSIHLLIIFIIISHHPFLFECKISYHVPFKKKHISRA